MGRIGPLAVVLFLLLSSVTALAQVPAECLVPPQNGGRNPYETGMTKGASLILSAWKAPSIRQSCDKVGTFETTVATMLGKVIAQRQSTPAPSVGAACEFAGWVQGAQDQLDSILGSCADTCFAAGTFLGDLAAIAYCELSILLGGLGLDEFFIRGPVQVCGLTFEVGCDQQFLTSSASFRGGACRDYTQAPFLDVYLQTQNNQCAYNPIDPDDPNP